jgi:hypothetical protein
LLLFHHHRQSGFRTKGNKIPNEATEIDFALERPVKANARVAQFRKALPD